MHSKFKFFKYLLKQKTKKIIKHEKEIINYFDFYWI